MKFSALAFRLRRALLWLTLISVAAQTALAQVPLSTPSANRTGLPGASAFNGEEWLDFRQNGVRVTLPVAMAVNQVTAAQLARPISRQRILGAAAATSGNYTLFMTTAAPAAYDAVQLVMLNETNDTTNSFKATLIAPASYNDGINGLDASGAAITPTAVTWPTAQSQAISRNPRNIAGAAVSSQAAGASGTSPDLIEGRAASNIIPLASLTRTDVAGAPPLLMVRTYGTNVPAISSTGLSAFAANSLHSVDPNLFCQYVQNSDQTGAASGVAVASTAGPTNFCPAVEIIYYLRGQRIFTLADTGDSLDEGWANTGTVNGTAGLLNGWPRQFAALMRAGGTPVGFTAWHRDGFTSTRFNEKALGALIYDNGAGVTHLFIKSWSVNETGSTTASVNADLKRVDHMLDLAYANGITPILVYPWAGQAIGSGPELQVRAYIDAAKARGVATFDARAIVSADGGTTTTNLIKPSCQTLDVNGAQVDTTHINGACQAAIAAYAYSIRANWNLP